MSARILVSDTNVLNTVVVTTNGAFNGSDYILLIGCNEDPTTYTYALGDGSGPKKADEWVAGEGLGHSVRYFIWIGGRILLALMYLIHGLGVFGNEDEAKPVATERTLEDSENTIERSSHHHHVSSSHSLHDPTYQGFWKKKLIWKPRWVKTWQPRKIYVGVWKRMWGPALVKEWVPVPKPPPGWVKPGHYFVKGHV